MKKRIKWTVIISLFLVYAALLFGCTNTEEPNVDNNKNTSDSLETTEEDERQKLLEDFYKKFVVPSWGDTGGKENNETANRIYIDEFYNIDILINIIDEEEILKYTFNDFIYNYDIELPVIYQYIKGLNVSKSDFIKANEISKEYNTASDMLNHEGRKIVYTDEQIEALYSDDKGEIFEKFGSEAYYYFEGEIYDYYELISLDNELWEKILFADKPARFAEYFSVTLAEMYKIDYFEVECFHAKICANYIYSIDDYFKLSLSGNPFYSFECVPYGEEFYPGLEGLLEINKYFETELRNKSVAELDYLPPAYLLVEKFSLKERKEEFYNYNEYLKVTEVEGGYYKNPIEDRHFELLFGDHSKEEIVNAFKSPAAFYFEGVLYILKDLKNADSELIDKMGATTEFREYLLRLDEIWVYKEAEAEYGSLVDGWLEKYYGIKD